MTFSRVASALQQKMHLFNFENVGRSLTLCGNTNTRTLAHAGNWIAVSEFPAYCMIENAAHRVADFFSRATCKKFAAAKLLNAGAKFVAERSWETGALHVQFVRSRPRLITE
jgi:hypothetical protein